MLQGNFQRARKLDNKLLKWVNKQTDKHPVVCTFRHEHKGFIVHSLWQKNTYPHIFKKGIMQSTTVHDTSWLKSECKKVCQTLNCSFLTCHSRRTVSKSNQKTHANLKGSNTKIKHKWRYFKWNLRDSIPPLTVYATTTLSLQRVLKEIVKKKRIELFSPNFLKRHNHIIWRVQMQKPLSAIWNFLLKW